MKEEKKKILYILSSNTGVDYFKASLTYKMLSELEKYFIVEYCIFLQPKNRMDKFQKDHMCIEYLRYNSNGVLKKTLNVFTMLYKRFSIVKKTNADLIWFSITSSHFDFFSFLYPIAFRQKTFYAQLYTSSVNKNRIIRRINDWIVGFNLKFYKNIGGGPEELSKRYNLNHDKVIKMRIGMFDYGSFEREYNTIRLLYIGTLKNRDIHKTIEGFGEFLKVNGKNDLFYEIIGKGDEESMRKIEKTIKRYGLEENVLLHGYIPNEDIPKYLKRCNVGVSFVPLTSYYEGVKITKTIEYMLAGMPVIATENEYNRGVVNNENGVFCGDDAREFYLALEKIEKRLLTYKPKQIRESVKGYTLASSVKDFLVPELEKII